MFVDTQQWSLISVRWSGLVLVDCGVPPLSGCPEMCNPHPLGGGDGGFVLGWGAGREWSRGVSGKGTMWEESRTGEVEPEPL